MRTPAPAPYQSTPSSASGASPRPDRAPDDRSPAAAGARGELEIHPGVHHGFAFPQRWCYDKLAAERHWQRLLALYRRNL